MALARKIAYNVIWNSFFKVTSTVVLSLLAIRLITGYLGPEGFGDYATILAFFAFFSAVADLGMAQVTAREISREGADEGRIFGSVLTLRLMASLALLLLSPLVIWFFDYNRVVEIGILFAAIGMVFASLSLLLNGIFQKNLAMDKVAMVEFGGKLFQVGLVILIVRQDWGFLAVAATLMASLIFNSLTILALSRRYLSFRLQWNPAYWKEFLRESWPMGMTAIITFAYFKMDTILLSVLQSSAAVGVYNVAYKIMENLVFFPAMLAGLILPLLSRYIYTNRAQFEEIANKTFKVFFLIIVPIVVATWFLAGDIIGIVSGEGFAESATVLRILIFALSFIFFGHYFIMLLVVSNNQKKLMQMLFLAAVFNISLNFFLIPRYSYVGAAVTAVLTEALVVFLTSYLAYRYIGYLPNREHMARVLFSGACMAGVFYLLTPYSFFVSGVAGVGAYALALWLTKAINRDEILSLFQSKEARATETIEPLSP